MRVNIYLSGGRETTYDLYVPKVNGTYKSAMTPAYWQNELYHFLCEHGYTNVDIQESAVTRDVSVDGTSFLYITHFSSINDKDDPRLKPYRTPDRGVNINTEFIVESENEYDEVLAEISCEFNAIVVPESFISKIRIAKQQFIGARKINNRSYTALLDLNRCEEQNDIRLGVPKCCRSAFTSNLTFMENRASQMLKREVKIVLER